MVLLDVIGMLIDDVDDLKVQGLFLLWLLLAQSVRFLITVSNLVVEVHLFPELCEVLLSHIFIEVVSEVGLHSVDFQSGFNLVDFTISVKVVFWGEACRV